MNQIGFVWDKLSAIRFYIRENNHEKIIEKVDQAQEALKDYINNGLKEDYVKDV